MHVVTTVPCLFHYSVYVKRNRTEISIHTNRNVTAGRHAMLLSVDNYVRVWTAFTAISTQYHSPNFTLSLLVLSSLPPLFTSLFSHPFPPLSLIPLPSPISYSPSLPYLLFPSPLLVLSSKVHSRNKSITQLHTVTSAHTYTLLILYVCTHTQHTQHIYVCTYTICDLQATYLHSVEYIHALYHYIRTCII